MTDPLNPDFKTDVAASFAAQGFMETLGATLSRIQPGEVDITLPFSLHLSQQDGFAHAGSLWSIGDSAAGYAALSLMAKGERVLTTEMKINLMAPAVGAEIVAKGRVIRFGRTLCTTATDIFAHREGQEKHVATMLGTMMRMKG